MQEELTWHSRHVHHARRRLWGCVAREHNAQSLNHGLH